MIVASVKRDIGNPARRFEAHDLIRRELVAVSSLDAVITRDFEAVRGSGRLAQVEDGTFLAAGAVATAAYWGSEETDQWWLEDLQRLGQKRRGVSGSTSLIELTRYPATILLFAAGISALARQRWDLLSALLTTMPNDTENRAPCAFGSVTLHPAQTLQLVSGKPSKRLHDYLTEIFVVDLGLGKERFVDLWERFELILASLGNYGGQGSHLIPHETYQRAKGWNHAYEPVQADSVELMFNNDSFVSHMNLDIGYAQEGLAKFREMYAKWADDMSWRGLPPGGGALPSGESWRPEEWAGQ